MKPETLEKAQEIKQSIACLKGALKALPTCRTLTVKHSEEFGQSASVSIWSLGEHHMEIIKNSIADVVSDRLAELEQEFESL